MRTVCKTVRDPDMNASGTIRHSVNPMAMMARHLAHCLIVASRGDRRI